MGTIVALTEYRTKMRAEQKAALEALMNASERLGLNDAEFPDRPVRGTPGVGGNE